jgi:hypothetical protein
MGLSTKELDETIKKLNDTFSLTFICKSCGVLAFLLKVNGPQKIISKVSRIRAMYSKKRRV